MQQPVIHPEKVAAYIRWSTDDQGRGTTLAEQQAACMHYIQAQGWHVSSDRLFVDDGYSGATLDRPAMKALRAAVAGGAVQCVVVYALDRLSRSVVDTVELVLREWDQGRCYLRCVREPIDTSHPAGRVFFSILASFAEFERDLIRQRTLGGKQRRARQGANAGWRYNYGFVRGVAPGRFQVQPQEAAVVRRLYREYLAGRGYAELAARLNAEGLPAPAGGRWSASGVRSILANPIYMGRLEYGRERRIRREGRLFYQRSPTPRYAQVEGAVPALVDRETWEAVQRRRRDRARQSPRTRGEGGYLLSGLARCGHCGRSLAGARSRDRRYYRCLGRREQGTGFCRAGAVPAAELERAVVAQALQALQTEVQALLPGVLAAREAARREEQEAARELRQRQRAALHQARQRLDRAFDRGELAPLVYNRRIREVEERLATLDGQQSPAPGEGNAASGRELAGLTQTSGLLPADLDLWQMWQRLDSGEQKALLQELVLELRVYREGMGKGRTPTSHPVALSLTLC